MRARKSDLRVHIVGVGFVLATLGLWGKLIQIQVIKHNEYKARAIEQTIAFNEIAPVRGSIFDRNGRPLALNVRSYSVSLRPGEVKDPEAVVSTVSRALGVTERSVRRKLQSGKSFVYVKRRSFPKTSELERLTKLAGVGVDREADRVYPFGDVAAKIVGFVGFGDRGLAGIERSMDRELHGVPGREEVLRNGEYRSSGYVTCQVKAPQDGRNILLTLDATIQEIAEYELAEAVDRNGAKGGCLIVMEVTSGDILALAEQPAPIRRSSAGYEDSLWTIRSISCVYEPGSTFKLVTAAALLEANKISDADRFDAEDGEADLEYAMISDPQPHGVLDFTDGFKLSSNIVMAKAARRLTPQEFYNQIRLFGFGSKTKIRLSGESAGFLSDVKHWSGRTQITLAFGQEIATTPLQMLAAFAAVANDGALIAPRIIRGIGDPETGAIEFLAPTFVRNVVSGPTARKLTDLCRQVVESGTGAKAAVGFMNVAGKTGTGQKAVPNRGYLPGKYIASFIGFAPSEHPQIACLVMLDEPAVENRFGSESAAPVFARMNRAIASATSLFDEVLAGEVIEHPSSEEKKFKTPNFIRMNRGVALERARKIGARVVCRGEQGQVFAQDPDPGIPISKDEVLSLYVRPGTEAGGGKVPDLRGLSLRAAKRLAAEMGVECVFEGSGYVKSQQPEPGKISKKGRIILHLDPSAGNLNS
jgi:stage V sporulation protein D (sporulation-specific penicillin-binding protein)